uniref:Uncharacterized protein n=1 Tax=Anguilla anguilla TaxID=7936 RepID=A0A0E9PLX3_ANGAN
MTKIAWRPTKLERVNESQKYAQGATLYKKQDFSLRELGPILGLKSKYIFFCTLFKDLCFFCHSMISRITLK